ncbi:MAG: hypothetical protein ACRDGN_13545 [bacterium]
MGATVTMDIGYRPARLDDLPSVSKVLADAIGSLSRRHGYRIYREIDVGL